MYNLFKYNGCLINDFAKVHIIDKQILPAKGVNTIKISSRDGAQYNGSSYDPLEVNISLYIDGDDEVDYMVRVSALRDIFQTKDIVKVSFTEDTFMMGLMVSEFKVTERTDISGYSTIQIICYSPVCYSEDLQLFENEDTTVREVEVVNQGGLPTLPFMRIGFSKDSYYMQIEKASTGERILVGEYPKIQLSSAASQLLVLNDPCESLQNWANLTVNIDSGRTAGGAFGITSSGDAICLSTIPSSSTTEWAGGCYVTNVPSQLDEFMVQATIMHNSTGKNGDPTIPDVKTDTETVESGGVTTFYEVTASVLNVRSGPGTSYKKIGSLKKGYKITTFTIEKGWLKITYSGKVGYVSAEHCAKRTSNNKVTQTIKNFVVTSTTGTTNLRATPSLLAPLVTTIPIGKIVRVIVSKKYSYVYTDSKGNKTTYDYYQLYTPYEGKYKGYISVGSLKEIRDVSIEYDYADDVNIADDKTGVLELYGFDSNGSKLFKAEFVDEQQYFEYTKPIIQIGNKIVAQDSTNVPKPNSKVTDDNGKIKTTTYLSGKLGNWNELYGKLTILRSKTNNTYVWDVTLQKIVNGVVTNTLSAHNLKGNDFPTSKLSYIALYIGTQSKSMTKAAAMSLTGLKVYNLNNKQEGVETNTIHFHEGDILDIDFENNDVYINEVKRNDLVDIGSRFFTIDEGADVIKIQSDDTESIASVVIREQWNGSVR